MGRNDHVGVKIAAIKAYCDAATPAPWSLGECDPECCGMAHIISHDGTRYMSWSYLDPDDSDYIGVEDADFIVNARSDLPRVLAALELACDYLGAPQLQKIARILAGQE